MSSEDESSDEEKPGELEAALEALAEAGSVPPTEPWETLVEWEGEEATRKLVKRMRKAGEPGIHAVRILAERGDAEAVVAMAEMLVAGDIGKLMCDELTFACHKIGAPALDPLLEAFDRARESGDADAMLRLLEAAFQTGVDNRRMSRALATQVEYDPAVVRRMLPDYGSTDEVVDLLEERAAAIPDLADGERPGGEAIQAIWNTIEQLGGEIPEELRREMRPTAEEPDTPAESYIKGELG